MIEAQSQTASVNASPREAYSWLFSGESLDGSWSTTGDAKTSAAGLTGDEFMVISKALQANANYDSSFTLSLKSSGGVYDLYSDVSQGSGNEYYLLEISNPQISGGVCEAKASLYESSGGNPRSLLGETSAPCGDGKSYHLVSWSSGEIIAYVDRKLLIFSKVPNPLFGPPAVGGKAIPEGNGITELKVRPLRALPPMYDVTQHLRIKPTATSLTLDWPDVEQDRGVGIAYHLIYRDGVYVGKSAGTHYVDQNLTPSRIYSYKILAVDFYGQSGADLQFQGTTSDASSQPAQTAQTVRPSYLCDDCDPDPGDPDPTPSPVYPPSYTYFDCWSHLKYRPVDPKWALLALVNHAYIYQTYSAYTTEEGYPPYTTAYVALIEGLPQYSTFGAWGNMVNIMSTTIQNLEDNAASDSYSGALEDKGSSHPVFTALEVADINYQIQFIGSPILYNPVPILGPGENSNWFAWWILNDADSRVPGLLAAMGTPPNAPGFPNTAMTNLGWLYGLVP